MDCVIVVFFEDPVVDDPVKGEDVDDCGLDNDYQRLMHFFPALSCGVREC